MDGNCWESSPSVQITRKNKCSRLTAEVHHGRSLLSINLDKYGISWKINNETNVIKYQHVINVKRSKTKPEICINYVAKGDDSKLHFEKFKVKFETHDISENWSKSISKQIKKKFDRIKSLVVIIDKIPNRCKIDGNSVFKEYIHDIIHVLKIDCVVREINSTKDINDLEELFESIKSSDGIVILSGDETASAIISNVINFFQTDQSYVKHVPVPFSIIPIGNHNDISRSIWNSEDVQNIVLNIFLCSTFQTDILSITKDDKPDKTWGFNCHYGFYTIFEKYRLLDTNSKESLLMKKALKKMRSFDCAIQYKLSATSSGQPIDDISCNKNCSVCNLMTMSVTNVPIYRLNASTQSASTNSENYETIKDSSDIGWIIVNSIPCRNEIAENAFTPACHFNDGSADMVLVKSTHVNDMKKYLKCLKVEGSHLKLPFVDSKRVEDIHVCLTMNSSWTNYDDKLVLESPISRNNKNNMLIIEDTGTSSSSEEDETKEVEENVFSKSTKTATMTKKKKIHRLLQPIKKVCKDLTRSTQFSQENDNYKRPNMLESDKDRERKAEKLKKKNSEVKKFEASWMLDYNFIGDINSSLNIKIHSGVISFFGDSMN